MSIVNWKLVHYPRIDTKNWDSGVTLTKYRGVQLVMSIGKGKDSFSFKINNDAYTINEEDKIDIFRRSDNDAFTNDDLLMSGVVRVAAPLKSGATKTTTITGYNYSDSVMSGLVFVDATNLKVNEMLQQAVNSLQLNNDAFTVTWNSANRSTTTGGSDFPICNERIFNRPFAQVLDSYSASDKTGDVNYYWFVNKDNELTWSPINDAVAETFDEEDDPHRSLKNEKDVNDVKNYVIIKGGNDAKGRVLQNRAADYPSITKHGFKYHFLANENATTDSVQEIDKLAAGVDDMKDASYPFAPYWFDGATVSGFNDYNTELRAYLRALLKSIGKSFIEFRKNGKLKIVIQMKPQYNNFRQGNMVQCSFLDASLGIKNLRVEEVNYTTTNDAIAFVEDIGTL